MFFDKVIVYISFTETAKWYAHSAEKEIMFYFVSS